jgi:hypothetical protein
MPSLRPAAQTIIPPPPQPQGDAPDVGVVNWGDIGGTMADQIDLGDALALKANADHQHDGAYAALSHGHAIGDTTGLQTALDGKQASLGFTAVPNTRTVAGKALSGDVALVKADVGLGNADNTADTAKPISTATQTALDAKAPTTSVPNASYRTILDCTASHTAARVVGTYWLGQGQPAGITGTGTLYAPNLIYIAAADFPTLNGVAPKLRIRAQLYTNDVAPTGNYTLGLYPVTRPGTSGGAGVCIFTMGAVVSGSNGAVFTTPAADGLHQAVGADFALPADGHYAIGFVSTANVAANAHVQISASLQMRNA